jgi:hypothetical protein
MSLFLQIAITDEMRLPFEGGSVLSVFQCLVHDIPFEELETKSPTRGHDCLPRGYYKHANYVMFLTSPGEQTRLDEREPYVRYSPLAFEPERDSLGAPNHRSVKIGGSPFWVPAPNMSRCCCGADMRLVCSLPANLQFPREAAGPGQTNGRQDSYFLFTGLSTFIFACAMQCKPPAVVAIRQN